MEVDGGRWGRKEERGGEGGVKGEERGEQKDEHSHRNNVDAVGHTTSNTACHGFAIYIS